MPVHRGGRWIEKKTRCLTDSPVAWGMQGLVNQSVVVLLSLGGILLVIAERMEAGAAVLFVKGVPLPKEGTERHCFQVAEVRAGKVVEGKTSLRSELMK